MKVIRGIDKIKRYKRPVVAIGVFDGVHRGHRVILKAAVAKARRIKGTSVVLTFWPDPHKQGSLYSLQHRLRLIKEQGIEVCIVLEFDKKLAGIAPEGFVSNILFKKIGASYVYVGKNFRFGKNALGSCETLSRLSGVYNFKLKAFAIIKVGRRPISSTRIRKLIRGGDLDSAKKLLSRPISILGTVIKGTSLAKKIGFPTANIDPHHEVVPLSGVYAVKVALGRKELEGICNIGTKPTFMRTGEKHIEVHIFNFRKNIYGEDLEVKFIKRIRKEKKFVSIEALAKQIKNDIAVAKNILSRH